MESTKFLEPQHAAAMTEPPLAYIANSTMNLTSSFFTVPSTKDLALLPFRMIAKADRLLLRTVPNFLVRTTGIAALTNRAVEFVWGAEAEAGVIGAAAANPAGLGRVAEGAAGSRWSTLFAEAFQSSTFKSYWGMLHYVTSRWAFTCFVMALILNRISVFGSSRQRIFLTWSKRFALRFIPIMLFISQIRQLLQAIRCQTSPDFSLYRHGDNNKYSILDWSTDGGSMHTISSTLLQWSDDEAACRAVGMSRPEPGIKAPYGSFSLLWPTFLRLSLSHIVENLSCSLQQIPVMTEVGISVFEHSLAFAEAETMVSHTLGFGLFQNLNTSKSTTPANNTTISKATIPASGTILAITDAAQALTGPHLFDKVNVPVEVLIVALLSSCNSLTSHLISVVGKQRHWRLINTGFWAVSFMAAFVWGFFNTSNMVRTDGGTTRSVSGLLHFPTVAIVGFLPHMAIILGIIVCGFIYLIALLLTAVSLGTNRSIRQPSSLSQRIVIAHDNLQAAIQMKAITIRWYEDFYTALLRIGFASLTAASEAVFLNEGRSVEMRQFTWLEEDRMDEIENLRAGNRSPDGNNFQIVEEYGIPGSGLGATVKDGKWQSGYAKERKVDKPKDGELQNPDSFVYPNPRTDGVGALQRTTRFYLLFIFLRGIIFTISGWFAYGLGVFLDSVGLTARPRWLNRIIGASLKQSAKTREKQSSGERHRSLEFRFINDQGKLQTPESDEVDIETEMRKRVNIEHPGSPEEWLDQKMYDWWKIGGWYGTKDESGDYQPSVRSCDHDEDTTSVVSTINSEESTDRDWESEPEGQRTPTQISPDPSWSFRRITRQRSETPSEPPILDSATLARLLNPPNREARDEARLLASHLGGEGIMTRSRYRQQYANDKAKILLAGRSPPSIALPKYATASEQETRPLSGEEEAEILEQMIMNRRQRNRVNSSTTPTWVGNGDDSGHSRHVGPPCVVCQGEPRTIIAWPCRCLTVCEDCRVSLAMNNFGNCVTCRRSVGGFVRLYVP